MTKAQLLLIYMLLNAPVVKVFAQPVTGTQLWVYNAGAPIVSCPAIAADGTAYILTYTGFHAITNNGASASNKWVLSIGESMKSSAAIGSDGTIYVPSGLGRLYAINADGSQKWFYQSQGVVASSPAIGVDNTIYFMASGQLYALSQTGSNKWVYMVDDPSTPLQSLSPAVGADGTIYVGSYYNKKIFAVNSDGTEKWEFLMAKASGDSPAIGADGSVYVTGLYLYALTPTGTNMWYTPTNYFSQASPAIGKDGTIYASAYSDLSLYAITPGGQVKWYAVPYGPNTNGVTTPVIDSSGMIYYAVSNSVFALNPQGSVQWVFVSADAPGTPPSGISPAIGPDGTIYAVFGSHLYAIAGTNTLGNTPWPMYRQNLRHTGKLEKPSLNQPKKRADAGFEFQMFGEVGQPYTIQRSTNLASWAVVTNFIASTQTTSVVDFSASNSPARFYRALIQ